MLHLFTSLFATFLAIQSVDSHQLHEWLAKGEAVLVDVRETNEFQSERIEGAISVPLSKIDHMKLPEVGEKKLVLHCRSGVRSKRAIKKLQKQMPESGMYDLKGGILAWEKKGLPVSR